VNLGELLHDLAEGEPLYGLRHQAGEIWSAYPNACRWWDVARWLSTQGGGLWFPKADGVTWVCGRRVEVLLEPKAAAELLEARSICLGLGAEPGRSLGGCARGLLAWVGPSQYAEKGLWARYSPHLLGYHDCTPGQYEGADLYDVASCYYSLLSRLPSLRVSLGPRGLVWHAWGRGEEDRWCRVLEAVAGHKRLRNTMWGASIGGTGKIRAFCRGEPLLRPSRLGPFRPAGLVVGRTAWELCAEASRSCESVLSNTDSVVALGGLWPAPWADYGLRVRVLASGDADICHWGSYRVGGQTTTLYDEGSRTRIASPRKELTHECLYTSWLQRA
jgi:hypothetical protein